MLLQRGHLNTKSFGEPPLLPGEDLGEVMAVDSLDHKVSSCFGVAFGYLAR